MLVPNASTKKDFSSIIPDDTWSFREFGSNSRNYVTHSYHRYPAKFIPQLVKKIIEIDTKPGDIVLDPFGGCGTTLVEAKILGREGIAFDINPVAKLITNVKIVPIHPIRLNKSLFRLVKYIKKAKAKDIYPKHSERIYYWFDKDVIRELDQIYWAIHQINDKKTQNFLLCCFSHILKDVSRWLMKSTKPQVDHSKKARHVLPIFSSHLKSMTVKNTEFYKLLNTNGYLKSPSKMRLVDSTRRFPLKDNSIDLIVTSPPYVTSYEYADLHQLTLLWLGDDKKRYPMWFKYAKLYTSFRKKFVGTKLYDYRRDINLFSNTAIDIVEKLPKNRRYADSVKKYFIEMKKSFQEMYRVLKPGKAACVIIGNTILSDINIKNAEVAVEQMCKIGFTVNKVIKREISNKSVTPWRDKETGKFTNANNKDGRSIYRYEYVLLMQKR